MAGNIILRRMTDVDRQRINKMIKSGAMVLGGEPDEEYVIKLKKQQDEHGVGWGLKKALEDFGTNG